MNASFHSAKLERWIVPSYLSLSTLKSLQNKFSRQQPFPYLALPDFFLPERATALFHALSAEQFLPQEADLFKFKQTADCASSTNKTLLEFHEFLRSPEFVSYVSFLTFTMLKPNVIDLSATRYEDTDFLLCHDDQLEGRKIAYFYYLSSLKKNDGGNLNLFAVEQGKPAAIAASIIPTFNTFAFFLVSEKSFHEVEEVIRDVQRIAMSGWFHDQ